MPTGLESYFPSSSYRLYVNKLEEKYRRRFQNIAYIDLITIIYGGYYKNILILLSSALFLVIWFFYDIRKTNSGEFFKRAVSEIDNLNELFLREIVGYCGILHIEKKAKLCFNDIPKVPPVGFGQFLQLLFEKNKAITIYQDFKSHILFLDLS